MPYKDIEQRKAYNKAYKLAHPDLIKQLNKKSRLKCKEKRKVFQKQWRQKNRLHCNKLAVELRKRNPLKALAYKRAYNEKNKDKITLQNHNQYINNKEKAISLHKKWALNNKEKIFDYERKYWLINKKTILAYNRIWRNNKYKTDPLFKLRIRISSRINELIGKKGKSICKLLPYNFQQLRIHLEKQFDSKMSWANHGTYWELDHKIPCSWYPTKESLLKHGFKLENLQPIEKNLNRTKSDSYVLDVLKNPICNEIYLLEAPKEIKGVEY